MISYWSLLLINIVTMLPLGIVLFIVIRKKDKKYNDLKSQLNKLSHQKKSSEVRLGQIGENLAPFLEGWPHNSKEFRFLGHPIDGVQFNEDEIVFIEIKTGNARLSKGQKNIKRLISEGKVYFETFRISNKGLVVNRDNEEVQDVE